MAPCWLAGTRPRKTRLSVPRLTPLRSARTRTSPARSGGSATSRSSPRPGAAIQKARATSLMEDAFVEHVLAETEPADARPQALVRFENLRQHQARPSRAQEQRRHHELQPVDDAGDEKARDGDAAALDEEEMESARGKRGADRLWREPALAPRQADDLGLAQALA